MKSVCIATYNGEKYIKEQLDSILRQVDDNDEVIISDDGSTDATVDIITDYKDKRIKLFHNTKHGFVHNFENAIKRSSGDFIFLSDQDDIWMDNKVSLCMKALENHILINHNSIIIDSEGKSTGTDYFTYHNSKSGFWQTLLRNSYCGCCMAFRKELLKYILPFPENIASHDMWIGLIAEKRGKTALLEEALISYRRHGENASSTSEKSKFGFSKQLSYRLYLLAHSLSR